LAENLFKVVFGPASREILDIDIVECFSHISSVLRLISLNLEGNIFFLGLVDSLLSTFWTLEADETILSRSVVIVKRDLKTLDLTVFLEYFLEHCGFDFSRNFLDENIVVLDFFFVASEEVLVER
jgi:hypothetical protein